MLVLAEFSNIKSHLKLAFQFEVLQHNKFVLLLQLFFVEFLDHVRSLRERIAIVVMVSGTMLHRVLICLIVIRIIELEIILLTAILILKQPSIKRVLS